MGVLEYVLDLDHRRLADQLLDGAGYLRGELGADLYLGLVEHLRVGGHTLSQPHIAADDAVMPHYGLAAEYGGPCVDDHSVLDSRLPLAILQVLLHGQRSQGHPLVHLHIVADDGCLPNDDSCAVVDAKIPADLCARMDVDASLGVRGRGDHPGEQGHLLAVELVGDAVEGQGMITGIGPNDLEGGAGRRVALVHGLHVRLQHLVDLGQCLEELVCDVGRLVGQLLLHDVKDLDQPGLLVLEAPLHALEAIEVVAGRVREQRADGLGRPVLDLAVGDHK